jgi:hypothetical protein
MGADGVSTQIADQQDAPSHSGVVSFDMDSYKVADTVTVTLTDMDLNVDSDLIDVYTARDSGKVDNLAEATSHLLDVTFDDIMWPDFGTDTGFTLVETDSASGIFTGTFQVPDNYSTGRATTTLNSNDPEASTATFTSLQTFVDGTGTLMTGTQNVEIYEIDGANASSSTDATVTLAAGLVTSIDSAPTESLDSGDKVIIKLATANITTTGKDIEVNYNDHRDGSGNTIEVGSGASIRANTGSVSLDRSVYPVPFDNNDFSEHSTATGSFDLAAGPVELHIRVTDADNDTSATGEDTMSASLIDVKITRGSLTTADLSVDTAVILETSPSSGVFEYDLTIASAQNWTDGEDPPTLTPFVVNQGDIITVTYNDPQDASGKAQSVTDSSSFDL